MKTMAENRKFISFLISLLIGGILIYQKPFPSDNYFLKMIMNESINTFQFIRISYNFFLFSTPYILISFFMSLIYIFLYNPSKKSDSFIHLPKYEEPEKREKLYIALGEVHHPRKPIAINKPNWMKIPERGLNTGVFITGAIGSAKTAGCMYPYTEQLLRYKPDNEAEKVGALILEVKGNFCYQVQDILKKAKREEDYIEISIDTDYRYNPLQSGQDPYAMAFQVASLLNNLFGKSKEPFWQMAYTNMIKFIIHLHIILYNYVTFFDLYKCAIDPKLLSIKIKECESLFTNSEYVILTAEDYVSNLPLLGNYLKSFECFEGEEGENNYKAIYTEELKTYLDKEKIKHEIITEEREEDYQEKYEKFEAVKRWFYKDWMAIDQKLRTSIVEGISVFLSNFDDNPDVKKVFCPDKRVYDKEQNKNNKYGVPFPSFNWLVENGKVCALNFPVSINAALARVIGTMIKMDFQKAMLDRIPEMTKNKEKHFRSVAFICDEYQMFATCGEDNPNGDEKFFSLSRESKLIPICATQSLTSLKSVLPGSSWETLYQTFRTRIFLGTEDNLTAKQASEYCGETDKKKINYNVSESNQNAKVSFFSGKSYSDKQSVSVSRSINVQKDFIFRPNVFTQLPIYQSIVVAFDGMKKLQPTYCYLKPYYLDINKSYFKQLKDGEL